MTTRAEWRRLARALLRVLGIYRPSRAMLGYVTNTLELAALTGARDARLRRMQK